MIRPEHAFRVVAAHRAAEEAEEILDGEYFVVRLIETRSTLLGTAVTVPDALFDGPNDERWEVRDDGWERVR